MKSAIHYARNRRRFSQCRERRENMLRELWEREEYHLFTDLIMIARKDFYSRHDTMTDEEITLKYQQVIGGF